jgi:hypothetical protein
VSKLACFSRGRVSLRVEFNGKEGKARGIGSKTSAMEKQTKNVGGRAPWKQGGVCPLFRGGGGAV